MVKANTIVRISEHDHSRMFECREKALKSDAYLTLSTISAEVKTLSKSLNEKSYAFALVEISDYAKTHLFRDESNILVRINADLNIQLKYSFDFDLFPQLAESVQKFEDYYKKMIR